jgi:hypothetical protein
MLASRVTLTRDELYEKVWSTPMQKLAADFGFSGVGFAKLCRRHRVPVPPRGYWARLQACQAPKRTALPTAKEPKLNTVEIYPHERPLTQPAEMEAQEIPNIVVADDRPLAHPITLRIENSFSKTRKYETGLLAARPEMAMPLLVSAEQLPRALRILDILLEVLEQAEYPLAWPKPYNTPLTVAVLDEPLAFGISEAVKRKDHQVTASEKHLSSRRLPRWDYEPTGCLTLAIKGVENLGIRHSWSDGKKQRVEDVLGRFIVTLPAIARALKRRREELAEQQRKWAEERKRAAEEAARRAEYERRAKAVEGLARSWEQGKSLRAFAERLTSMAEQEGVPEEQRRDIRTMAEWAVRHAGFVDPFTHLAWMVQRFKNPPWSYGS